MASSSSISDIVSNFRFVKTAASTAIIQFKANLGVRVSELESLHMTSDPSRHTAKMKLVTSYALPARSAIWWSVCSTDPRRSVSCRPWRLIISAPSKNKSQNQNLEWTKKKASTCRWLWGYDQSRDVFVWRTTTWTLVRLLAPPHLWDFTVTVTQVSTSLNVSIHSSSIHSI